MSIGVLLLTPWAFELKPSFTSDERGLGAGEKRLSLAAWGLGQFGLVESWLNPVHGWLPEQETDCVSFEKK
jgi:hypothetical protein